MTNAAVSISTDTATITLSASLVNSTGYYVQIAATAFEDTSDNPYAGISDTTTWSFTTIAAPAPASSTSTSSSGSALGSLADDSLGISFEQAQLKNRIAARVGYSKVVSVKIPDADTVHTVRLRVGGKAYYLTDSNKDAIYTIAIPAFSAAGNYPYALTADWGGTTRTTLGIIVVTGDTPASSSMIVSAINSLFRMVYGTEITYEQWAYWSERIADGEKKTLPELFGAMQWQRVFGGL